MGTTGGKFVVEYEVMTAQLQAQLNRASAMIRNAGGKLDVGVSPETTRQLAGQEQVINAVRKAQSQANVVNSQAATIQKAVANATSARNYMAQRTVAALNRSMAQQEAYNAHQQKAIYLHLLAGNKMNDLANKQSRLNLVWSKGGKELATMGLALRRMLIWWGSAAMLLGGQRLVRSILDIAGTFQYTVRELMILGDEGERVYSQLARSGYDAAAATGRSFGEAAEAMKAWVRQGYSASETNALVRTTLIGLNLTEMSSIELVRTLTAQMRAFNIPATDSISIIDKLVGVSRRYAIETSQLAVGMRRFAASASEAGVSMEQQAGLMVAMMTRTQQAAQMVGRAGRTILVRMRKNAADSLQSIADIDVYADKAQTTYRSLWDVLSDLAAKWPELTDAQRAQIAFQSAGLRQQEFFIALMKDFALAQEAEIEALHSAGLAYKANTLLVSTYRKALAGLKTEWEKLLSMQSGILDYFTAIVNGLRQLIDVSIRLPGSLIAVGTALATMGVGIVLIATTAHPVIGAVLAIAGAFVTLMAAIGKFRGSSWAEMAEKAREISETHLAEAKSVEGLAKVYIKLYDQYKKGRDTTDLLAKARAALDDVNPSLLSGERELGKVYDILKDKLPGLTEETEKLAAARKELNRRTLESVQTEAIQAITKAREEAPEDVLSQLKANPVDFRMASQEIEQLASVVQDKLNAALIKTSELEHDVAEMKLLKNALNVVTPDQIKLTELQTALVLKYFETMEDFKDARFFDFQIDQYELAIKAGQMILREREKELNQFKPLLEAYRAYLAATDQLAAIAKKDAETKDDKKQVTIVRSLQEQLALLEAHTRLELARQYVTTNRQRTTQDEMRDREILLQRIQEYLAFEREIVFTDEKIAEVMKLQQDYAEGGIEYTRVQKENIDDIYRIQEDSRKAAEKAAKEAEQAAEKQIVIRGRIGEVYRKYNEEAREASEQYEADRLAATYGQLTADKFLLQAAIKNYKRQADAYNDLVESQGANVYNEERLEALQRKQAAQRKIDIATQKLQVTATNQRASAEAHILAIQDEIRKQQISMVDLIEGGVEAARETVIYWLQQKDILDALADTDANIAKRREIETGLLRAQGELKEAYQKREIDYEKALIDIAKDRTEADIERISLLDGEMAAALATVEIKKLDLKAAQRITNLDERDLAVKKAQVELQMANDKVLSITINRQRDHAERMVDLENELGEIQLGHQFRVLELTEGRAAAYQMLMSYYDEEEIKAKKIIDVELQKERLKEIEVGRERAMTEEIERQLQLKQQILQAVTQFIGQQAAAVIGGNWTAAGFVTGAAGLGGSLATAAGHPEIAAVLSVAGPIIGALLDRSTEDLEEELDKNTMALERNTQTLQDVFEQRIAVPSFFTMPASIQRFGQIPSAQAGGYVQRGGLVNVHAGESISRSTSVGEMNFYISGPNAKEIAGEVKEILVREFNVDSRRGYVANPYGR